MKTTFTFRTETPLGFLDILAAEDGKLLRVDVAKEQCVARINAESTPHIAKAAEATFKSVCLQLSEYFTGTRTIFDLPVDINALAGTGFQKSVWEELLRIPFGTTLCYGDIARSIANEKAVRAVGGAIGANPLLVIIPCHRVIGKDGSLTGFSAGIERKIYLLKREGIL